jgi:hypothetical protein
LNPVANVVADRAVRNLAGETTTPRVDASTRSAGGVAVTHRHRSYEQWHVIG